MAHGFVTKTGGWKIGFRRGWSDWQKDLKGAAKWAADNGFGCLDLGGDAAQVGQTVLDAGLAIGSADLANWSGIFSSDPAKRTAAVEANADLIDAAAALGVTSFFCVVLPEDPNRPRSDNFADAVAGFRELAPILEKYGARAVIEGWPGPGALCCTPADLRALFEAVPSRAIGINYDPSHLLRMGIDPVRFAKEFAPRVGHVHGKDTKIEPDDLYLYGTEQPATFRKGYGFGAFHWRYTIPGRGDVAWSQAFAELKAAGYQGYVSIELEDQDVNGTEDGEKNGLLESARFLSGV